MNFIKRGHLKAHFTNYLAIKQKAKKLKFMNKIMIIYLIITCVLILRQTRKNKWKISTGRGNKRNAKREPGLSQDSIPGLNAPLFNALLIAYIRFYLRGRYFMCGFSRSFYHNFHALLYTHACQSTNKNHAIFSFSHIIHKCFTL